MAVIFIGAGVIGLFCLAFLVDISINLRRVDADIKKMIKLG